MRTSRTSTFKRGGDRAAAVPGAYCAVGYSGQPWWPLRAYSRRRCRHHLPSSSPPSSLERCADLAESLSLSPSGSWAAAETGGVYGHARVVASREEFDAAAALATARFARDGNQADAKIARECNALVGRLRPRGRVACWLYVGESTRGVRLRKGEHTGGRSAGGASGAYMIITSAENCSPPKTRQKTNAARPSEEATRKKSEEARKEAACIGERHGSYLLLSRTLVVTRPSVLTRPPLPRTLRCRVPSAVPAYPPPLYPPPLPRTLPPPLPRTLPLLQAKRGPRNCAVGALRHRHIVMHDANSGHCDDDAIVVEDASDDDDPVRIRKHVLRGKSDDRNRDTMPFDMRERETFPHRRRVAGRGERNQWMGVSPFQ